MKKSMITAPNGEKVIRGIIYSNSTKDKDFKGETIYIITQSGIERISKDIKANLEGIAPYYNKKMEAL